MDTGMLWFDNDSKMDLSSRVKRAVAYYRKKYGAEPNACFVHPSMLTNTKLDPGSVKIFANNTIMPNHFWIGCQKDPLAA
jgi:hypothetical protein